MLCSVHSDSLALHNLLLMALRDTFILEPSHVNWNEAVGWGTEVGHDPGGVKYSCQKQWIRGRGLSEKLPPLFLQCLPLPLSSSSSLWPNLFRCFLHPRRENPMFYLNKKKNKPRKVKQDSTSSWVLGIQDTYHESHYVSIESRKAEIFVKSELDWYMAATLQLVFLNKLPIQ